jgi:demethylmenaquinone methyltransferase/2-methoxy-6-polyprenyl-1,4-benzoquinol methylase
MAIARVLAELTRVLKRRGRLALVSLNLSPHPGLAVSAYSWLHRRFPHWIDCRPIQVSSLLKQAGYRTKRGAQSSIWGLPVMMALAFPRARHD